MFVRDIMTRNAVSVASDASIEELLSLMTEKTFEAIPVRDNGKVIGIVTDWDIITCAPACSAPDFYAKTKVKDVMTTSVVTVTEDEIVEMAAYHMYFHDLDALPVVDPEGHLIGIVTQNDVFRALVTLLGLRAQGTRLTLDIPNEAGMLSEVAGIVGRAGINISSLSSFSAPGSARASVILRVKSDRVQDLVQSLSTDKVKVTHISDVWK